MSAVLLPGLSIDRIDVDDLVAVVDRWCDEGAPRTICCVNVHLLELARREASVRNALTSADLRLADGAPIAWLASRLSGSRVPRVTGSDVFEALMYRPRRPLRHFLFGSTDAVVRRLAERLADCDGQIVGALAPPFDGSLFEDAERYAEIINETSPDVVWIGLGAPKQELWAAAARMRLDAPVVVPVGAVFDFASGTRRRAPQIMQKVGLEWLHRLLQEPRRLGLRYLDTNLRFLWTATKALSQ